MKLEKVSFLFVLALVSSLLIESRALAEGDEKPTSDCSSSSSLDSPSDDEVVMDKSETQGRKSDAKKQKGASGRILKRNETIEKLQNKIVEKDEGKDEQKDGLTDLVEKINAPFKGGGRPSYQKRIQRLQEKNALDEKRLEAAAELDKTMSVAESLPLSTEEEAKAKCDALQSVRQGIQEAKKGSIKKPLDGRRGEFENRLRKVQSAIKKAFPKVVCKR